MKTVEKVERKLPVLPMKKRVAAYARVSMDSERLQHSLSAQVSYYSELIQKNPEWEYAGVFADYGISGTSTQGRTEYQRMLEECEAGQIDIILCKSISRFARNTVDLLNTVRHLKELGIEVRFEKEHINSMSGDGEFMLSILASFAQEESRSISENVKWGTVKRFQQGIPNGQFIIYGYRWENDELVIVPEEAEVIRRIYKEFMEGLSRIEIGKRLNEEGITTRKGCAWVDSNIKVILTNITYTGNLLFQKEYRSDPIEKKRKKNHGELPQYYVENTHEAIIPMDEWQNVQEECKRRKELGVFRNKNQNFYLFSGKIKCPYCKCSYVHSTNRRKNGTYEFWGCQTNKVKGGRCPVKGTLLNSTLEKKCAEVLEIDSFDSQNSENAELFNAKVDHIEIQDPHKLTFFMRDSSTVTKTWESTGKRDCWTEDRRKQWSELHKNKDTNPNKAHFCEFTGFIKCGCCGANYRTQERTMANGSRMRSWHCTGDRSKCHNPGIKDETMKRLVTEVLGIETFDEKTMDEKIEKAVVLNNTVTFHFRDGHAEIKDYKERKTGTPWTPEWREKATASIRASWTDERRAKASETMKRMRAEEKSRKERKK